ncbi:50S ribosomal protein L24 [Patescibacteria group bacterium]|uniref:Large ribosomal subunit protein uL24 n=1 Tax=candidate division WWE3 bacterium TaxID=2053526 RepID=A0A928TS09_UNCKA|nr:50S ribosomal protein L24 [candidate division WWE3 bacterium]MCL4732764.1 50S ribosomal protein L24 [Patescibacteria group bacterium]MDL1952918.1 50S ribosomal protein L24 [Candidatus Uhrbacteria bacterium UHB]RIL00638.1 MAG: 50S ribosomal protein L24 [Candidatus Uhrbacteria bacterium]
MKLRIRTGDTVKVIAGKDKGKSGKVIQTFPKMNRIVVEGVHASKRHLRSRRQGEKGQIVEFFMPIHASNVQVVGDDGVARRHKQRHRSAK